MNRTFQILALSAGLILPAFSPALATMTDSGKQVRQIQESRERQMYGDGPEIMTGRSATEMAPPARFLATPINEEDQVRVLEGVDPAVE